MNIVQVYFNSLQREPRVEVTFSDRRSRIDLANDLAIHLTGVMGKIIDGSFHPRSSRLSHEEDGTVPGSYLLGDQKCHLARIEVVPPENKAYVILLSGFERDKKGYLNKFAQYLNDKYELR